VKPVPGQVWVSNQSQDVFFMVFESYLIALGSMGHASWFKTSQGSCIDPPSDQERDSLDTVRSALVEDLTNQHGVRLASSTG